MKSFIIVAETGIIELKADYIFFDGTMTHLARKGESESEEIIVGIIPARYMVIESAKQEDEQAT